MTDRDNRRVRGTKRVTVWGQEFDSKREAQRYQDLKMLERAGEIRGLERQVPVELVGAQDHIRTPTGKPMKYIADFYYFDTRSGLWVYEDAKGYPTDTYKMKRAILAAMGIEIRES